MFSFETKPGAALSGVVSSRPRQYALISQVQRVAERNASSRVARAIMLKTLFHEVECAAVKPSGGHTHGVSAAARSTASRLIDSICNASGNRAVFYQGSAADLRNGRTVTRTYHWAKDVYVPVQSAERQENDVLALVDVDYYVDMPAFLAEHHQPVLLYTVVPSAAGKDTGEYKYRFNQDGTLDYLVSGGGHYSHRLWDWSGDALSVKTSVLFGTVTYGYYTYAIERRAIDDDHSLILLTPLNILEGFQAWYKSDFLAAKPLTHVSPIAGAYVRLMVNKPDGLWISTSKVGQFLAATVPVIVDDSISVNGSTRKGELTLAAVKKAMGSDTKMHLGAEVLWAYHKEHCAGYGQRFDLADGVRRFQWVGRDGTFDEDAKPAMQAFMRPLVDNGFVADVTRGNEQRGIAQRVEKNRRPKEMTMSHFMSQCMDEFVRALVPEPFSLHPVDDDEVARRQSRPTQRRQIEMREDYEEDSNATSFQKRQAEGKVGNPRPVTVVNPPDKLSLAPYIYALDPVLHAAPWWIPGTTPLEQAERVAYMAESACNGLQTGDCSALDSTMNVITEELQRRFFVRAFHRSYHLDLYRALRANRNKTVIARFGTTFETWFQTVTGSMKTTVGNTVSVGFAAYLSVRLTGFEAGDAYGRLGAVCGDDVMQADVDDKTFTRAFRMCGLIMNSNFIARGCEGVEYLSRCYGPDVWWGDSNSTCDILRQAGKFHLTVCLPSNVSPERKLVDKAYAFWLSDAQTPIIGDFVCRVKELFPALWPSDQRPWSNITRQYVLNMDANNQYPNEVGGFATDIMRRQIPDFDYGTFMTRLGKTDSTTIFTMDLCHEPLPLLEPDDGEVVVDGDLLGQTVEFIPTVSEKLPEPSDISTPLIEPSPPRTEPRKFYRGRKPRRLRDEAKPSLRRGRKQSLTSTAA